jgi:hypothetical protein
MFGGEMKLHHRVVVAAGVLGCLVFGGRAAHADIYTYSLSGPVGSTAGGSIGGSVVFVGNPGDPVPNLSSATTYDFTYTPTTGPVVSFMPPDTLTLNYNATADFFGGHLGDTTITSTVPPSGAYYWTIDDTAGNEFDLFWTASPIGPSWEVRNSSGPVDNTTGLFALHLISDVVPEPQIATAAFGIGAMFLSRRRRHNSSSL